MMHTTMINEIRDTICDLSIKKDNWDDGGAKAPDQVDVANALNFLDKMSKLDIQTKPVIELSWGGEISFVWRNEETGLFVDLGFYKGVTSVYMTNPYTKEEFDLTWPEETPD